MKLVDSVKYNYIDLHTSVNNSGENKDKQIQVIVGCYAQRHFKSTG